MSHTHMVNWYMVIPYTQKSIELFLYLEISSILFRSEKKFIRQINLDFNLQVNDY